MENIWEKLFNEHQNALYMNQKEYSFPTSLFQNVVDNAMDRSGYIGTQLHDDGRKAISVYTNGLKVIVLNTEYHPHAMNSFPRSRVTATMINLEEKDVASLDEIMKNLAKENADEYRSRMPPSIRQKHA